MPDWAKELSNAPEDSSDEEVDGAARKKQKKDNSSMSMLTWVLSFERYALAAAAVGQWDYWSSRAHLENCHKVAGLLVFRVFCTECVA